MRKKYRLNNRVTTFFCEIRGLKTIHQDMQDLAGLKKLLQIPKDIVITSHRNPDGDAIGSSLALSHYLRAHGHTTYVMAPSEYPDFLEWMPGAAEILIHDIEPEVCNERIQRADIIFCLDYNALDRVDKMGDAIAATDCTRVMIDHHLFPDEFCDHMMSDITASSTCEMVFDFVEMCDDVDMIDKTIAEAMYTGILTDTGSFKYATSPKLFRIAAQLKEKGVDDDKLQDLIFNALSEKSLRLLGHCLANRMEIIPEYKTGIIWLTKEDYEVYDIKRGETEGIVNYLLKMRGIKVAAFIHEQPKITKMSLRSKGDFSVQEIATKYFKGGGHKNASGGASFIGLGGTIRKFKNILPEYAEQLEKL